MSREPTVYAAARSWNAPAGYGISPDQPVEGFYRMRLRFGGIYVGIRIWYGAPHEPWTGEEMDRGWRWQAEANGRFIEFDRVWPQCAGEPIDETEHDHLARLQAWGVEHAPDSGMADPRRPLDPLSTPLMF